MRMTIELKIAPCMAMSWSCYDTLKEGINHGVISGEH